MTNFNTIIFSASVILLLSACVGEETSKEKNTIVDHKIDAVNEAKKSVAAMNTQTQAVSSASIVPVVQTPNASSLYTNRCASCHGINAEKSALNASQNIAQWDSKKIQDALQGYKNGSFGGKMKAIMQAQSKSLTNEEIKLISDYITTL